MIVLPAALRRRSDIDAIRDDIAPYVASSPGDRAEVLSALCRFSAEQISAHPRGAEILAYQDPRSAASLLRWRELVALAAKR